jgi:hypothetical protein
MKVQAPLLHLVYQFINLGVAINGVPHEKFISQFFQMYSIL